MVTYICLATFALLLTRHLCHCWQATAPTTTQSATTESAIAPPTVDPSPVAEDLEDLLSIPAQPRIELIESALPALAKLYSVPGASKWSNTRKLRQTERQRVLQAIAA